MIKSSPNASLGQYAVRDRLRAHARAAQPAGARAPAAPYGAAPPAVVVIGDYRLDVDPDTGALIAVHQPTGHTQTLFAPPWGDPT